MDYMAFHLKISHFLIYLRTPSPPAPAYPCTSVWWEFGLSNFTFFGLIQWGVLEGFISAHSDLFPACFSLLCLPYIICIYLYRSDYHQFPFFCPVFTFLSVLFTHPLPVPPSPICSTKSPSPHVVRFFNCIFSLLTCYCRHLLHFFHISPRFTAWFCIISANKHLTGFDFGSPWVRHVSEGGAMKKQVWQAVTFIILIMSIWFPSHY